MDTKRSAIVVVAAAACSVLIALAGCEKQPAGSGGPAERAGKQIDKALEKAGQNIEKAGERIQDAAKGK
jgi:archaellin